MSITDVDGRRLDASPGFQRADEAPQGSGTRRPSPKVSLFFSRTAKMAGTGSKAKTRTVGWR